ncbi:ubiquitin carboxyl-terminal hydrolase, family 1 [Trichoderma arundinaceum]|uniref:Ubiquitin carboxyl-terminal hydrolase n=1 Tax=Trichoderma arundinaceum TaxID=490622 RepID=A0A395NEC1_TRIAR|nr:ubiquitin carboxyl-terminal hydrolase, family 1 [Trichoderma arundinaceum]
MPTEGVYFRPSGQKTFIPLENNPEVFTSLVHDLGVSPDLGFYDVYSLDDPDLLSLVPRPVLALIFITPTQMYYAIRKEDGTTVSPAQLTYDKSGNQEPVLWFQQTIGHACGLMALLHSVANGEAREFVQKGSFLDELLNQTTPLKPVERAAALYNNEELEKKHMKAARTGSSHPPGADEENHFHFISYVKGKDGHLWELEGATDGPLDRGPMREGDDVLSDGALDLAVRKFLNAGDGNLNFSIVALARKPA